MSLRERQNLSQVSQAFVSVKNQALGEVNLPRVLYSRKNCTRKREAFLSAAEYLTLREEWHSAKTLFLECNTRGRAVLGEVKCYLTAQPTGAVSTKKRKKIFPESQEVLSRVSGHGSRKKAGFPSALTESL